MRCVRGGSHSDVSVGYSERSLSEISQRGCAGGPHVGTVWVSVWRLLVRGPPLLAVLPLSAREGHRDFSPLVSCCSVGVTLCHLSPQMSSESAPPTVSTHLSMPLRTRQHPGSESLLYGSLSPEHWRPLCVLGFSHSLRSWLRPHCCVHPGVWGPEARHGYR